MKKYVIVICFCLLSLALLGNGGRLVLKNTSEYAYWRGSQLLENRLPVYINSPLPLSFADINNSASCLYLMDEKRAITEISLNLAPQYLAHNFQAYETTGWLYNGVPYFLRHRYDTLQPWAVLIAETEVGKGFMAKINLDIRKDYRSYISFGDSRDKKPAINLPVELLNGDLTAIDMSGPSFGYLAYGSENIYASIGRTTVSWGPMRNGLTLSDASQYYDNFAAAYLTPISPGGVFSYSFNAISVIPMLSTSEWERQSSFSENSPHYWDLNQRKVYDEASKWIFGHRVDISPVSWLRLGIGEMNVVGGKKPDLTDLNPFIIFHNTYGEGYSNVMLAADFSILPYKGLRLYGEFAMDDFNGPNELDARGKPTAQAFGGGIEYAFNTENGMILLCGEAYHTDTWMYNRWQPLLKWTNRTYTKSELPGSRDLNDYPIGFKYGPDLNGVSVFADYISDNFEVRINYDYFVQGEVDLNTPYLNMDEPSDEPGEFTDKEDWRGPIGETTTANILSGSILIPWKKGVSFGGDLGVYFGDYFAKYDYAKTIYEIRPYISYEF